jgi:hypothetical protein
VGSRAEADGVAWRVHPRHCALATGGGGGDDDAATTTTPLRSGLSPKLGAIRGWAFVYNFTNTTLYPVGTADLYAGLLRTESASWDTKHGIRGYSALLKAEAMASRGILPLIYKDCWNSPYPKARNKTSVLDYSTRVTFPYPWIAGTAVD